MALFIHANLHYGKFDNSQTGVLIRKWLELKKSLRGDKFGSFFSLSPVENTYNSRVKVYH